jgi:hypothetical protein
LCSPDWPRAAGNRHPASATEDLALEVLDTVLQEELDDPRLPLLSLLRLR